MPFPGVKVLRLDIVHDIVKVVREWILEQLHEEVVKLISVLLDETTSTRPSQAEDVWLFKVWEVLRWVIFRLGQDGVNQRAELLD